MMKDAELGRLLDQIEATNPNEYPRQFWADSMMKWFSQTFTTGTNPYGDTFERDTGVQPYRI